MFTLVGIAACFALAHAGMSGTALVLALILGVLDDLGGRR